MRIIEGASYTDRMGHSVTVIAFAVQLPSYQRVIVYQYTSGRNAGNVRVSSESIFANSMKFAGDSQEPLDLSHSSGKQP